MSINFRLTVIGRMTQKKNEELIPTIKEVLELEGLEARNYKNYKSDMNILAKIYGYERDELYQLIPDLTK